MRYSSIGAVAIRRICSMDQSVKSILSPLAYCVTLLTCGMPVTACGPMGSQ